MRIEERPATESFEIRLPHFEGPFDLLLFFIERDELDIHDIPIATITNDFMEYMHQMQSMNIELASEFILVAATLMRIKAKMLLPRYDKDDQGNDIDPRQDLVRQLLDYKQFKSASEDLRAMEDERLQRFERGNIEKELAGIIASQEGSYAGELNQLTLFKLISTFEKVMARFEENQNRVIHTIVQYPYTIDSQKSYIGTLVSRKTHVSFADIFEDCTSRLHAVFNFLALLELLQNRTLLIFLGDGFNNFVICTPENAGDLAQAPPAEDAN
jgi:segregation and condensation protein A